MASLTINFWGEYILWKHSSSIDYHPSSSETKLLERYCTTKNLTTTTSRFSVVWLIIEAQKQTDIISKKEGDNECLWGIHNE